jgi:hypothetical protein
VVIGVMMVLMARLMVRVFMMCSFLWCSVFMIA